MKAGPKSRSGLSLISVLILVYALLFIGGVTVGATPANDHNFRVGKSPVTMPGVITMEASNVSYFSATLNGNLNDMGTAESVTVTFEYGTTTDYGKTTSSKKLTAVDSFNINVSNLAPDTIYHFRAKADGGENGVNYGVDKTFTTLHTVAPVVVTLAAQNVTLTSANVSGSVDLIGTADSVKVSFEYGTTTDYSNIIIPKSPSPSTISDSGYYGGFFADITDLIPGTEYHYRAVADGGGHGVSTGADMTFTTAGVKPVEVPPVIITYGASEIKANSAQINANLTSLGSAVTVNVYFEYGLTNSYGNVTSVGNIKNPGLVGVTISNLEPSTNYHYRVVADGGAAGIVYGDDEVVATAINQSGTNITSIISVAATNVTDNSVVLRGRVGTIGSSNRVAVFFDYGATTDYGSMTDEQIMTSASMFYATLSGLKPGTTYHFRAVGDDGRGPVEGSDMLFTTLAATPSSTTTTSTAIITTTDTTISPSGSTIPTTTNTPEPAGNSGVIIGIVVAVVLALGLVGWGMVGRRKT